MIEAAPARKVERARREIDRARAEVARARMEEPWKYMTWKKAAAELRKFKEELSENELEDILLGIAGRAVSTALCSARCLPPLLGARCLWDWDWE
jgi:hypothetical protein